MCMALLQRKTDVVPPPPPLGYDFRWCLPHPPLLLHSPRKRLSIFCRLAGFRAREERAAKPHI